MTTVSKTLSLGFPVCSRCVFVQSTMLTRIRRISDDKTIGSYYTTSDAWGHITELVNQEWPCSPDGIDLRERDDGIEEILVRNQPVAYLQADLAA